MIPPKSADPPKSKHPDSRNRTVPGRYSEPAAFWRCEESAFLFRGSDLRPALAIFPNSLSGRLKGLCEASRRRASLRLGVPNGTPPNLAQDVVPGNQGKSPQVLEGRLTL